MHRELYQQGLAKADAGDLEGAIVAFDQALQLAPDFTEAYYNRGLVRFKLNHLQGAITDYTRALLSDANNASLYYARGLAHLSAGSTEAAIDDAKQAVLLKPDHAAAYSLLGAARQRQSAIDKALASYKKAAELYLDQQDIANCRRCLQTIRQLQPSTFPEPSQISQTSASLVSSDEFLQQAVAKAKQKNVGGAMDDLDWAIQLDPQDAQAYASRGHVRSGFGDWQGAIDDYRMAAQIYLHRADKLMAQQMIEAIEHLKASRPKATASPTYPRNVVPFPSRRAVQTGRISSAVQQKLLRLVGDDRRIVAGLVERLKARHPGMPEDWYWEKAIYDLERDRW
ncbi:MAG: tetratricopeptide repeat protein [Cyanobacteria bacterium CRU_2_1]|nr:tetratricopeptide repeat protein [Cyanobacteria bacterium RU_5_0]NJR57559.1 tetratricopeptide repeat protein [Cyanobacteria bacterium CRU_2_1]